jgi:hypothetical protein
MTAKVASPEQLELLLLLQALQETGPRAGRR